jgi:hypothetical protein
MQRPSNLGAGYADLTPEALAGARGLAGLNQLSMGSGHHQLQLQHHQGGNGNISLGGAQNATFALPNALPDGIALFGQMFPHLGGHQERSHSPASGLGGHGAAMPTRSNEGASGKSSSAYASRHQAAEQRRRTRINER